MTNKLNQIFHDQPLFILGICYFTFTSQHIDQLQRETEQVQCKQAFLFDRLLKGNFEQMIKPLVVRNCRRLIHCQTHPYATSLSSHSTNSEQPPSAPSLQVIDDILDWTIPLQQWWLEYPFFPLPPLIIWWWRHPSKNKLKCFKSGIFNGSEDSVTICNQTHVEHVVYIHFWHCVSMHVHLHVHHASYMTFHSFLILCQCMFTIPFLLTVYTWLSWG